MKSPYKSIIMPVFILTIVALFILVSKTYADCGCSGGKRCTGTCTNPGGTQYCSECSDPQDDNQCASNCPYCGCRSDGSCDYSCDDGDNNDDDDNGGGGNNPTATPTPTPIPCVAQTFSKASIVPSTLRPFDQVTVRCDYGKRLDCLSVVGIGLKNCRYSRYEGTDNIFTCDAGGNAGYYDDAVCKLSTGTKSNCCAGTNKVGNMTILGTDVHYEQDVVLPFGPVVLTARVQTIISKNKGVRITLICNSDTCANKTQKNAAVFSLPFPVSSGFYTKTQTVNLTGTGDDRHYLVRISVDKGSEAYFDLVSLKDAQGRELVKNPDFTSVINTSVQTKQPKGWGEGDNKVGFYYGSLAETVPDAVPTANPNATATPMPTGGSSPGSPSAELSLNLKIKFQGISKKPVKSDPINVLVKLAGPSISIAKSATFSVDDAGVWSGKVDFGSIPTGGGYTAYVKGPKHIQKKICDASPSETSAGTYHCSGGAITLSAGENTFDFSKIIQMAGDLPEGGSKQNGIVDAYDTTFIRTNLGSTEASKLVIGDLNLDGVIDTQDYSMVMQSLSIKFDEE